MGTNPLQCRAMTTEPAVIPPDVATLTFEQAMGELEALTRRLEAGQGSLDDAIAAYERGMVLHRHCAARLDEAEARIERLTRAADGTLTTTPLETG